MQSEHLRYLTEIGRFSSISIAAQKLYISQASLSTVLKNIEEEIGCELFKRTHNGVQITPEGEEALALVAEIEQSLEKISGLCQQVPEEKLLRQLVEGPYQELMAGGGQSA